VVDGWPVVEAADMPRRRRQGKSDQIDAARIAHSVLGVETSHLRQPRADQGIRAGLRILDTARDAINKERTAAINQLTALVRISDLGVDARNALTKQQISTIAAWRTRTEPIETRLARAEATRLARRIHTCDQELDDNETEMKALVSASPGAFLLNIKGIGAICATVILVAWSHQGRIRSESAFAALAGVNPIPASSGNTSHHRLNRGGDRRLNWALTVIANSRMAKDSETRAYIAKRLAAGSTKQDAKRILKRYIAREIWKLLNKYETAQPAI